MQIQNTGTVPISCIVNYYYQYPDGTGALASGQSAPSTGYIAVGETGSTSVGLSDRNLSLNSYNVSCSAWPFK